MLVSDDARWIAGQHIRANGGIVQPTVITFNSRDGTRVMAIALWESEADLHALRNTPKFQEMHTPEFYAAIVSIEPHVYDESIQVEKTV